jgi:ABC-type branched-subunit amino acid transport system ATPase component
VIKHGTPEQIQDDDEVHAIYMGERGQAHGH